MTTDTYSIQVAVDSTSAVTATRNLTAMEQATGRSERALSSLGSVAKIAGSALAGISIASLARDILKTNMEFESLRTSLETVTGSAKNAKIAFEGIQQFAAKTPYSVKEVTDAFIKMKALGLSPSEKALTSYGNTASAMGKSLKQMVEAVADAATGEFERLKEFGIKASKQGDDIKFTFKGVETKVKDSSTAITAYLQKLGDTDFAGGMERQGQTMKGTLSSLADAWDNFIDHILNDKSGGAISRWITSATSALGKFDVWLNGATTSIGKLAELQQEQNRLQASINAHNQNGVIGSLIDDLSGFDASGKQSKLAKNIEEQKRLRKELEDEKKVMVDITKAAPVSKIDEPDKKAAAKAAAEAKRAQAQATKELALAEKDYNEQINMQVAAAENAGKLFAAQQQTKIAALEAERVSIQDKAAIEYESAKTYEEKSRILNESQSATNLLLAKEKEIRDSLTNQSAETIDAKIAAAQAELDNAGKYNLTLAEQLRLKTEIAGLQTDKAVLAETSTQSDIKAKSDAEQKYNDDKLASIKAISDAQTAANTAASAQMDILTANLESAKEAATGLAEAFGSVGGAVGGLGVALASYEKSQAAITDGLQNQLFEIQKLNDGKGDQAKADKAIATASQKQSQLQVKSYGDMAAAAQGFFKKGTTGYQVLGAATKVFRAFEMAQSALSMGRMIADMGKTVAAYLFGETTKTTAKVTSSTIGIAADTAGAGASATKAVADASQGDPYTGLARGAMMLAFMVAIGAMAAGGGGGEASPMTGADYITKETDKYKSSQGGTVLGSDEMSNSILDALDTISSNSSADLDYTKGMARSLEVLSYSMKGVANSIAKNYGIDTSSLGLGTSTSGFFMTTTTTKEFAGSGIKFVKDTLGNIVESGIIAGRNYLQTLVTKTSSGFLGIGASTKQYISTKWSPLNDEISASIAYSLGKIQENVVSLADEFGEVALEKLKSFEVDLGKMPLGKDAAANTEIINAALSKQADLMAIIANYSYKDFQQVGEGYFQTLNRVSTAINTAETKLKVLGINAIEYTDIINKQGDIEREMVTQSLQLASAFTDVNDIIGKLPGTADDIIEAFNGLNSIKAGLSDIGLSGFKLTQDMINAAGGISAFNSSISDFIDSILSPEEQLKIKTAKISSSLESLGITMPNLGGNAQDSFDYYKNLLQQAAQDTTKAGEFAFVKLLQLTNDFASVATETAKLATDELNKTLDEFKSKQSEIAATIKNEQNNIVKSTDLLISVYKKLGEVDVASKEEALRLEREKAAKGMDAETASVTKLLQNLTYIISVFNEASAGLKSAYQSLIAMRDRFVSIGDSLSSYLGELNNTSSDYDNARTLFLKTSQLAKEDNEKALKDLEGVSKAFLSASKTRSDAEIQAAQDSVNTATAALTSAQDALASAQQEAAAAQLEAQKTALSVQKEALSNQVSALKESVNTIIAFRDKLVGVSKSLGNYLKELTNESGNYEASKAEFLRIAALAKAGDEQALQDLETASKDFLNISKNQIDESAKIFKDAIDTSKAGLKTAYDAVVALRDKFKSIRQSLVDYKLEITGAGTPQGSPESIYRSTKKAFEDAKVLAAGGNEQALADLPNAAKSFLDASLKYNATGMDYQADYKSVLASLDTSIAKVDSQIDILNKQLLAAESADKSLIDLNASALSIDEAIKAYKTALESESTSANVRYESDKALVIANATEVKANADLQITNSNKQIDQLNEQITLANAQISKIDEQLALFTTATKSLESIDSLTAKVKEAQDALNIAMAEQDAIDTKRYETDKETVKKNVEDALKNANLQIEIMNKQLTAAETANTTLAGIKSSSDNVWNATAALSQAVNYYIAADLTKNEFIAANSGLLENIKTSIAESEQAIINAQAQAVATASAASAAAADAAANAVSIANANATQSYNDLMDLRQANRDAELLAATSIVTSINQDSSLMTVKPYANGGMASGLSLVGEQGAELVNFTSPANVTSHQQTAGLFDSIGNAIDDQSTLLKEQIIELKALVNLQSNANVALINEMQGMKEELSTISRKAKLEAAA